MSLLLFVIPIVAIAFWFCRTNGCRSQGGPFGQRLLYWFLWDVHSISFSPVGFCLPQCRRHFGNSRSSFKRLDSVEEYLFYLTGFLAVLLIYVWLDEYWLAAYNVPDYAGKSKHVSRLMQFHASSLIAGIF